jgi:hypothetical protein
VCPATAGTGCAVAVALTATLFNATVALAQGASFESVVNGALIGAAAGLAGGGVATGLGGGAMAQIVGGAVSGALASAIPAALSGGDLGDAIFQGAANGALLAAIDVSIRAALPLSKKERVTKGPEEAPSAHKAVPPGPLKNGAGKPIYLADNGPFAGFADWWKAFETFSNLGARCTAGPCSDAAYFALDTAETHVSVGTQGEVNVILPKGLGGTTLGFNLQLSIGGWNESGLFFYHPSGRLADGFSVGWDWGVNMALGHGAWSGLFQNIGGSLGPVAASVFVSPGWSGVGPGWAGASFGLSVGPPSLAATETYYVPLSGQK